MKTEVGQLEDERAGGAAVHMQPGSQRAEGGRAATEGMGDGERLLLNSCRKKSII